METCLCKIQIIRWDAEISILKYSWQDSELVLYTSEDLNRYCINTACVRESFMGAVPQTSDQ